MKHYIDGDKSSENSNNLMLRQESGGTGNIASFYEQHEPSALGSVNLDFDVEVDIGEEGVGIGPFGRGRSNE